VQVPPAKELIRFDDFEFDESRMELRRNGEPIELQQKPLQLLCFLIRNRNRTISRDELLDRVWQGVRVSDGSLTTAVYEVRRALGDLDGTPRRVITSRGRGYRFNGPVFTVGVEPPTSSSIPLSPFIGRDNELQYMESALDALERGSSRILMLHGAPGTGKTSLALQAVRRARERGIEAYVSRALPRRECPPFWFWVQIVRAMVEVRGPAGLHALLCAERKNRDPKASLAVVEEDDGLRIRDTFYLFDGLVSFFRSASQQAPIVLALDDLHLADPDSLRFLWFLARDPRSSRILIVGTHRDTTANPLREDAQGSSEADLLLRIGCESSSQRIRLGDLSEDTVRETWTQAVGRAPTPDELTYVVRATGGTPFFVAELARQASLARSTPSRATPSRLAPSDGATGVAANALDATGVAHAASDARPQRTADAAPEIPDAVRDSISLRLKDCSPSCRSLLEALAAIGIEAPFASLGDLLGWERGALLDALEEARSADLLQVSVAASMELGQVAFRHGFTQCVVWESLHLSRRIELEERRARGGPAARQRVLDATRVHPDPGAG